MESHDSYRLLATPSSSLLDDSVIRSHLSVDGCNSGSTEGLELSPLARRPGSQQANHDEGPYDELDTEHREESQLSSDDTAATEAGTQVAIAISALVAIAITLVKFNNREQPDWAYPDTFNLSALIALLATILRSMVAQILEAIIGQAKWYWYSNLRPVQDLQAFDEAGHGAWGSVKLLFALRRVNWATLGSFVMILSLGVGTFTQQALRTVACSKQVVNASAFIKIAQASLAGFQSLDMVQKGQTTSYTKLDGPMQAAFISGISGLGSQNAKLASCTTGNCSFRSESGVTHTSLALNSLCFETTASLTQTGTKNWPTTPGGGATGKEDFDATWTNYSLYGELIGMTNSYLAYMVTGNQTPTGGRWHPIMSTYAFGCELPDQFAARYGLKLSETERTILETCLVGTSIIAVNTSPCEDPSSYNITDEPLPPTMTSSCERLGLTAANVTTLPGYFGLTSAVCIFYPSVQQYFGVVENGNFKEKLLGTPILFSSSNTSFEDNVNLNANKSHIDLYASTEPCFIDGVRYEGMNMTTAPGGHITLGTLDGTATTVPKRCLYGFNLGFIDAFSLALASFFDLNYADAGSSYFGDSCGASLDYGDVLCWPSWWLENLYNKRNASFDSIYAMMNRTMKSVTGQLRLTGVDWDGNPTGVTGEAFETVVCEQLRWAWLLFPAGLILASAGLLVATILRVAPRDDGGPGRLPVWKSSILPLIFYGLEDKFRLDEAVRDASLAKSARDLKTSLTIEKGVLRFREFRPNVEQ